MLYDVISFIQKNATTDEYDEGISKRLTEMMNTGKIQFDNIDERRGAQDLAGYWDGDRNTVTGQVRDIIVIDIERAISGGMEVLIDTLFHEGTHAYQFSLGLMNFDPRSEEEFIEMRTDIEYNAYNLGIRMANKYRTQVLGIDPAPYLSRATVKSIEMDRLRKLGVIK